MAYICTAHLLNPIKRTLLTRLLMQPDVQVIEWY
ncbi:MAG: hypothetical protein HW403_1050, partial [Dehalococcoidia bacterium]|nr:hypothetical protein [Dehalococcoidia bacterium]